MEGKAAKSKNEIEELKKENDRLKAVVDGIEDLKKDDKNKTSNTDKETSNTDKNGTSHTDKSGTSNTDKNDTSDTDGEKNPPSNRCVSEKVDILYGGFRAGKILGEKSRREEYIRKPKVG